MNSLALISALLVAYAGSAWLLGREYVFDPQTGADSAACPTTMAEDLSRS
jgi:hypothetical protein